MRSYLLRRLLFAPFLLLGVVTLTFLLVHTAPGEPFSAERAAGLDPQAAQRLRAIFGADDPLIVRYGRWVAAAAQLDFGVSFTYRRAVTSVIGAALGPTILLTGTALLLAILAGVVAACAATALGGAGGRMADRALTLLGLTAYSAPSFWIGVLGVHLAAVRLGWLPVSGWRTADPDAHGIAYALIDVARHLVLPCLTLAIPAAAAIALHLRSGLRESIDSPLGVAARARGATRLRVTLRHLRNASTSVIALLGFALPGLVGGSLVIEVLFAWPGMGRITYEAILARDLPVVTGAVAIAAALTLAGSLAADAAQAIADPRAKPGARAGALEEAP